MNACVPDALSARHLAFTARRQRLCNATGPVLKSHTTWTEFWGEIDARLRECGYARSTRRQFRHILRRLRKEGLARPQDITPQYVREYLGKLATRGASWSWTALHITVLRTVFDRLSGLCVTKGLVTPKRTYTLPDILTPHEAERLVRSAGSIRDQLLLGLLYGCGLSGSEALRLRWADVKEGGRHLHVRASTRYLERTLIVPLPFRKLLRMGVETCDPDEFVFRGRTGGSALSLRMVQAIVHRARYSAGINRPVSVMTLRHSYAVYRLENGINLEQLRKELGHASIRTTERYRRCLAPALAVHPFTEVRRRMSASRMTEGKAHGSGPTSRRTSAAKPTTQHALPLASMRSIDIQHLRLPLESVTSKSGRAAFLELLTNRLVTRFLKRMGPGGR